MDMVTWKSKQRPGAVSVAVMVVERIFISCDGVDAGHSD